VGYNVNGLAASIRAALGADKSWNVCLVGVGSLGTALIRYRGFAEQGFRLVAAFDVSTERIGCDIAGVPVLDIAGLESAIVQYEISLAILAVPAEEAQLVAGRLAAAGISGILNFAPLNLSVGSTTWVVNVDLASEMQQLSFAVARQSLLGFSDGDGGVSGP
jgi:redox-sensing transcriptional repressor